MSTVSLNQWQGEEEKQKKPESSKKIIETQIVYMFYKLWESTRTHQKPLQWAENVHSHAKLWVKWDTAEGTDLLRAQMEGEEVIQDLRRNRMYALSDIIVPLFLTEWELEMVIRYGLRHAG